ncbi:nitroreductase family protein [Arsenicicoccus dermatophilus]|uniref:nitroreductase family protein n=1 Tax=Arsenicicoccus dermatophilus TaxID=1076331 RepID=UPI001F4CD267|nr:nitroreductase family protein [Arsenicicoccus dermatophilus]MCH8612625.1 nitroreductase family protein [Arsenicicoccus dermatophilus]
MEHEELVRGRRMLRRFDPGRPVDEATITRALQAATRAPSAGWSQGWDFVVLRRPGDVARYWEATRRPGPPDTWARGVMTAPCLVIVCSDPERYLDRYAEPDKGWTDRDLARWPVPWWDVDAGMAALLALLSVHDAGLGGLLCGIPADRQDAVRRAFGIPAQRRLVGLLALGHPPTDGSRGVRGSRRRGRRPLAEVAHDGCFGRPWAAGVASGA